jgi:hypothetical protein
MRVRETSIVFRGSQLQKKKADGTLEDLVFKDYQKKAKARKTRPALSKDPVLLPERVALYFLLWMAERIAAIEYYGDDELPAEKKIFSPPNVPYITKEILNLLLKEASDKSTRRALQEAKKWAGKGDMYTFGTKYRWKCHYPTLFELVNKPEYARRLTRVEIAAELIKGGVEKNPGPGKPGSKQRWVRKEPVSLTTVATTAEWTRAQQEAFTKHVDDNPTPTQEVAKDVSSIAMLPATGKGMKPQKGCRLLSKEVSIPAKVHPETALPSCDWCGGSVYVERGFKRTFKHGVVDYWQGWHCDSEGAYPVKKKKPERSVSVGSRSGSEDEKKTRSDPGLSRTKTLDTDESSGAESEGSAQLKLLDGFKTVDKIGDRVALNLVHCPKKPAAKAALVVAEALGMPLVHTEQRLVIQDYEDETRLTINRGIKEVKASMVTAELDVDYVGTEDWPAKVLEKSGEVLGEVGITASKAAETFVRSVATIAGLKPCSAVYEAGAAAGRFLYNPDSVARKPIDAVVGIASGLGTVAERTAESPPAVKAVSLSTRIAKRLVGATLTWATGCPTKSVSAKVEYVPHAVSSLLVDCPVRVTNEEKEAVLANLPARYRRVTGNLPIPDVTAYPRYEGTLAVVEAQIEERADFQSPATTWKDTALDAFTRWGLESTRPL